MVTFYDLTKEDTEERLTNLELEVEELQGMIYYSNGNGHAGVCYE